MSAAAAPRWGLSELQALADLAYGGSLAALELDLDMRLLQRGTAKIRRAIVADLRTLEAARGDRRRA